MPLAVVTAGNVIASQEAKKSAYRCRLQHIVGDGSRNRIRLGRIKKGRHPGPCAEGPLLLRIKALNGVKDGFLGVVDVPALASFRRWGSVETGSLGRGGHRGGHAFGVRTLVLGTLE